MPNRTPTKAAYKGEDAGKLIAAINQINTAQTSATLPIHHIRRLIAAARSTNRRCSFEESPSTAVTELSRSRKKSSNPHSTVTMPESH